MAKAAPNVISKVTPKDGSEDGGQLHKSHNVPENDCSMYSAKAAMELRAKGDWYEKHERIEGQCCICVPSLMEKATAQNKLKMEVTTVGGLRVEG